MLKKNVLKNSQNYCSKIITLQQNIYTDLLNQKLGSFCFLLSYLLQQNIYTDLLNQKLGSFCFLLSYLFGLNCLCELSAKVQVSERNVVQHNSERSCPLWKCLTNCLWDEFTLSDQLGSVVLSLKPKQQQFNGKYKTKHSQLTVGKE